MDDKSISGLLAQLISKNEPKDSAAESGPLADTLKRAAGLAGGGVESAVNEFLSGQGELHETTRAAVMRGGTPASDVAKLLSSKFGLAPAIANLIAPLLVKLLPSIGQAAHSAGGETAAAKPKARRKAKPKTAASAKSEASKKAKKRTAAKPKKPAAKPAAKKKTTAKAREK